MHLSTWSRNNTFQCTIIVGDAVAVDVGRQRTNRMVMIVSARCCAIAIAIAIDRNRMSLCHFVAFGCVFGRTNTFIRVVFQLILADDDVV